MRLHSSRSRARAHKNSARRKLSAARPLHLFFRVLSARKASWRVRAARSVLARRRGDAINNQFLTAYRFVFTARARTTGADPARARRGWWSTDGNAAAISSASNPDGDNPPAQRAANVIDGDLGTKPSSKWLDGRMSETPSTLDLELASPAAAFTYEFWTANDVPWRDPIRWSVAAAGRRRQLGVAERQFQGRPPWSRASTYGRLEVAPPCRRRRRHSRSRRAPPLASPPPPYRWPPPPPPSPPPYPPPSFDLGGANSQALSESPSQTLAETSLAAQVTDRARRRRPPPRLPHHVLRRLPHLPPLQARRAEHPVGTDVARPALAAAERPRAAANSAARAAATGCRSRCSASTLGPATTWPARRARPTSSRRRPTRRRPTARRRGRGRAAT